MKCLDSGGRIINTATAGTNKTKTGAEEDEGKKKSEKTLNE